VGWTTFPLGTIMQTFEGYQPEGPLNFLGEETFGVRIRTITFCTGFAGHSAFRSNNR
jgi:hypothetical protein